MIFNVIIGFIIPFILTVLLYIRNPVIVLVIHPFTCILSHTINSLGVYFQLWDLTPLNPGCLSYLLFNIGLYAFLSSLMIYFIDKYKFNPFVTIIIFTSVTSFIEYIGLKMGKVLYSNEWNIVFTFLSYIIPYIIVYGYYLLLRKYKVFEYNSY